MFGELETIDKTFDESDQFSFNVEFLKSVDDLNVKEIVDTIESIQKKINYLVNVNKITKTELSNDYNL
ncbi:MAG: hypothetical protein KBS61_09030 [Chryseobacterium sp.]|nr:hypothetical protein [Candidatus Chryseobacterium enterohippi]